MSEILYSNTYSIDKNQEVDKIMGIFVRQRRKCCDKCHFELNDQLFDINTPFYMATEKFDHNPEHANRRIRKRKRNLYEDSLEPGYKQVIKKLREECRHLLDNQVLVFNNDKSRLIAVNFDSAETKRTKSFIFGSSQCTLTTENLVVPRNCIYFAGDVFDGLDQFEYGLKHCQFLISESFDIVIDPPWPSKSVRRKNTYETQDIHLIDHVFSRINELSQNLTRTNSILLAVWTTHKFLEYTVNQVKSCSKETCVILWHKITKSGESAKVRGSAEYLVIGEFTSNRPGLGHKSSTRAVIMSVPSSIHSHKPPINARDIYALINGKKLVALEDINQQTGTSAITVNGLELFARRLSSSIFSIGDEVLKLQSASLYHKASPD